MIKISKISKFVFLSALIFFGTTSLCQAEPQALKKGVAYGTFMLQGYSYVGSPGTMRFYAAGAQAAESSLSYVDDAYISPDNGDYQGNTFELKGTFSGGPNGVATFTSPEGLTFNIPLKNGSTFDLEIPGVQVHMVVSDPSIFDIDEEDMPPEYDPNAPLTDSGARAADISGQVEIACPPDFEAWDVLKMGRIIYNHCKLKTGEDSTLRISLLSGSSFTMKPETEIIVNDARKEKTSIQLLFGNVWANVKKMSKGEDFGFKGSQVVAGIKGTTFIMEEAGERTTLKVIEGEVELTDNADGKVQTVKTGEALSVDLRGFGEKTTFVANMDEKTWLVSDDVADIKETLDESDTSENKMSNTMYGAIIVILIVVIGAALVVNKKKDRRS